MSESQRGFSVRQNLFWSERPTRSAVCASSALHSLRLAWDKARLARQGWAGEKVAFLSSLTNRVPTKLMANACSLAWVRRRRTYNST